MTDHVHEQKYPIVLVRWEDTSSVAAWSEIEEAIDFDNIDFDYHCTSIGYLIRSDETCVVLAARADGDFTQVGLVERIPRGMVQSVEVLVDPS